MSYENNDDVTHIEFKNNEIESFAFLLALETYSNVKAGDVFPIKKSESKIGSSDNSDIQLLDENISKCNAVITFDYSSESFYVESYSKENDWTSINSDVLNKEVRHKLKNNDIIDFYKIPMVFMKVW